jgi:hypothetical protein
MLPLRIAPAFAILVVSPEPDTPEWMEWEETTDLEALVFFGFFRSREDRADFLGELRSEVSHHVVGRHSHTSDSPHTNLPLLLRMDPARAALAAVRLAADRALSYHTYSLRIGYAPYAVSAVLSFVELERSELERYANMASARMAQQKSRVLDAFGLSGYGEAP